jgi:protease I
MARKRLRGLKVAVLATDGFEQVELTKPVSSLKKQGAEVEILSLEEGKIRGVNGLAPGRRVSVDRTIMASSPDDYDALLLPGGLKNPDALRQSEDVRDFVRGMETAGKPIAVICHAPWILISSGVIAGRRLTSWPGIQDDVRNAGAHWIDGALVRDGNWVSSRDPNDLPHFIEGMIDLFSESAPEVEQHPARLLPAASVVLGAVAVGAVGYYMNRKRQDDAAILVVSDDDETQGLSSESSVDEARTREVLSSHGGTQLPPPTIS